MRSHWVRIHNVGAFRSAVHSRAMTTDAAIAAAEAEGDSLALPASREGGAGTSMARQVSTLQNTYIMDIAAEHAEIQV
eukprot:SAG31_NODE_4520_length_3170_cov_2.797134_3_plen_78_part_00